MTYADAPSRFVLWPRVEHPDDLADLRRLLDVPLRPWREMGGELVIFAHPGAGRASASDPKGLRIETGSPNICDADRILCWNQPALSAAPRSVSRRAVLCDPYFSLAATDALNACVADALEYTSDKVEARWASSEMALRAFAAGRTPLLVGSGPHGHDAKALLARTDYVTLWLGSALLGVSAGQSGAGPASGIIVAADSLGQFSDLDVAQRFQSNARDGLRRGSHMVVPAALLPVARSVLAEAGDAALKRLHAVPHGGSLDFLWRTGRAQPLGNVLTTLGLPLAALLAGPGGKVRSIGVTLPPPKIDDTFINSTYAQADHSPSTLPETQRVSSDLGGLEILGREPASVADPETYARTHLRHVGHMLSVMARDDIKLDGASAGTIPASPYGALAPRPQSLRERALASVVSAVDLLESYLQEVVMAVSVLSLLLVAGLIAGFGLSPVGAVLLGVFAVIALTVAIGLLLRRRIARWMGHYERRRRQLEAREIRLLRDRIAALEAQWDEAN